MISKSIIALWVSAALTGVTLAGDPHTSGLKGQPNQSCEDPQTMTMPGHSSSARGSAFNPNGIAGMNYAGEKSVNSKNPKSVSQYDVACFQQSARVTRQTTRMSSGRRH
jgi:hypothetical protein